MNLSEIEARLQSLIEVDLLRLLPGSKVETLVIQQLAAAIRNNARPLEDGSLAAPTSYTLTVNPLDFPKWQNEQLLAIVLQAVTATVQDAGFRFTISPTITVLSSETTPRGFVEVVVSHRMDTMADTNAMPSANASDASEEEVKIPSNAFLIVEGVKVYPLTSPVINIGRRLDNHLVIDDPRVSRAHSQLRVIKGRYVIFDLNSTGGTFVNGQRANQSVLYPGDVISLAGVTLIFGQDNPPPRPDLKDTAPLESAASNRPTAFLKREEHSTLDIKKPTE